MNRIENLTDLRLEIKRLQVVKASQEEAITNDIRAIEEALKPANLVSNAVSSIFRRKGDEAGLLKSGVNFGVYFLIEKVLLRRSSGLVRNLVSFIASNVATNMVAKNSGTIMEKLKEVAGNILKKKPKDEYFDSTYQEREIYNNEY
jgi:uncharacterized membrane protein